MYSARFRTARNSRHELRALRKEEIRPRVHPAKTLSAARSPMNQHEAEQLIAILGQFSPLKYVPSLVSATLRMHEDALLAQSKYQDTRSLARYRAQVCSQNGEDGIIAEIFRRIGNGNRTFVEIGVGDGDENNTRFLLESGWRGIWWEASESNCTTIRDTYRDELASARLSLIQGMVTTKNAADEIVAAGCAMEFDLLSIDIDMNTSHVWRALKDFKPRVAVIEYNPAFGPVVDWEVEYDSLAVWPGDNRFGASLSRMEKIAHGLGYSLVGCELTGINAFFVRSDLVHCGLFQGPFTAAHHFEPPRFAWLSASMGHPPAKRKRTAKEPGS
mgnify:CR=1 FL=1